MFVIARMHIDLQQLFRLEMLGGPRPAQLPPAITAAGCAWRTSAAPPSPWPPPGTNQPRFWLSIRSHQNRERPRTHVCTAMAWTPTCCRTCSWFYFQRLAFPQADRNDRFNGFTMAVLELRVPEGREVPLQNGLAFSPSKVVRLASGESFQQRFIQICDQRLEFTTPLPQARPGWPLPLARFLACLTPSAHEAVLGMLTHVVDVMTHI